MVNLSFPEIQETKIVELPPASLDSLKKMREDACSSSSFGFKLQPQQRFLRRVLSPDAPTQNVLLVHGTGLGKTCSAIQIAEEYIMRPEFQDKKVLVMANPSIQENFKSQIFDVSRVNVDAEGLLTSKQCTGRRYLDILQRGQRQPLKVSSRDEQEKLVKRAGNIIDEFYEFQGYSVFANILDTQKLKHTSNDVKAWIHATFDNRLIIIDEAHNLRESDTEAKGTKLVSNALKEVIQTANGITLVLLTATPMYDRFEEVFDYLNLFLWNSRKQSPSQSIHSSEFFTENGDFKSSEKQIEFRALCETYISFVKGENPFTFPFRLPPPESILAKRDRTHDMNGKKIETQIKYLPLTESIMSPYQADIVEGLELRGLSQYKTICTFPENKSLNEVFDRREDQYFYKGEAFLSPSKVAQYSSKFALITKILDESKGVAFVYSNLAEMGVQLFAMCLEEHGYEPALGNKILGSPSDEGKKGKGKYVLITSQNTDAEINRILTRLRRKENKNGDDIRIILASPKVSEGVDFRYVRQIHILDPWFNMSRIEQVIGRGMRVCSHSLLDFEEQNTTVYLHVCRYAKKKKETLDETIYREYVEQKGIAIAKVKHVLMESAMDCSLERSVNSLPADWKNLKVPQRRNQDNTELHLAIGAMTSPSFIEDTTLQCTVETSEKDPNHIRPLSAILDVRDEILDKLLSMFLRKPIWKLDDIYKSKELKQYEVELVSYILQNVIESREAMKDKFGRTGHIESKEGIVTFAIKENETMQDKILDDITMKPVPLRSHDVEIKETKPEFDLVSKMSNYVWPVFTNEFTKEIKEWYYVDNMLTKEDKIKYILGMDWTNPPKYASVLRTPHLYIFGSDEVYNDKFEKIVPTGDEKDEYTEWVKALKEKFKTQKSSFFAGMKRTETDIKLIFNLKPDVKPIEKFDPTKGISGRACISYSVGVIDDFMRWLGGSFPKEVSNRDQKCMYLGMKVRSEVAEGKEGLVWYTSEEWSVLSEDKKGLK